MNILIRRHTPLLEGSYLHEWLNNRAGPQLAHSAMRGAYVRLGKVADGQYDVADDLTRTPDCSCKTGWFALDLGLESMVLCPEARVVGLVMLFTGDLVLWI
jgi:hypothetical protein